MDIAPRLDELQYLAQCRTVNAKNKTDVEMPHEGIFSVVAGNRLPAVDKQHVVYLISVEGCEEWMKGKKLTPEEKKKSIRLISLAKWSFYCEKSKESFKKVIGQLMAEKDLSLKLSEKIYKDSPNDHLKNKFSQGYITLPYRLITGENSFAWYRGALSPVPVSGNFPHRLFFSAAQAIVFDEKNGGVFDQSYATAWQLGRTLAIADNEVGLHLMNLRRKLCHMLDSFYDWFSSYGHIRRSAPPDEMSIQLKTSPLHPHFCSFISLEFFLIHFQKII